MRPVKIIIKSANLDPRVKFFTGLFLTINEQARLLDYIDELAQAVKYEQA